MNYLKIVTILILFTCSCRLTDLEGYKHLEEHYDNIYLTNSGSYDLSQAEGDIVKPIDLTFDFSIYRSVKFDFFIGSDTTLPTDLVRFDNGVTSGYGNGIHNISAVLHCDPWLCTENITMRIRAISDMDTLTRIFPMQYYYGVECGLAGTTDSMQVKISYGYDTVYNSIFSPGNKDSIGSVLKSKFFESPYILARYSREFQKPYLMTLNNHTCYSEESFDFIHPVSEWSIRDSSSVIYYINNVSSIFLTYNNPVPSFDRSTICKIWAKNSDPFGVAQICEAKKGNIYLLSFKTYSSKVNIFMVRIEDITSTSNESGYIDMVVYYMN